MKAGGKGKQPKRFLDQSAALSLASSIAGIQEKKSQTRAEKNQLAQVGQSRSERPSRLSKSKAALKETKALIAAQRSKTLRLRCDPGKASHLLDSLWELLNCGDIIMASILFGLTSPLSI
ncbi:hypothetical protein MSAN_01245800 [Mycena sanguinolenta]|uniref:Uncharacterized protein n=1 Tax=Mycena sanguinolenta TaxID=230812 RepID=A0A8H7D1Y5_9AGAR|nr:hypothetical protein MSAN_01245800 [Mycena sanguinolenta]